MVKELPEKFVRLITESHGAKGEKWLDDLPEIISEIERNWTIKVGKAFANLSYHFVARCICADGSEAVLKIGFPEENSPVFNEAEMLKLYNGNGAVKFFNLDEKRLALLLEKLNTGEILREKFRGEEEKSVEIAVKVLQKILRKPPAKHNFTPLENWFAGFQKASKTDFPNDKIRKAQRFYEKLSQDKTFLIHGDFHHENILSAEREPFLAIDPKGVIGQIGYEIGVFLNNQVWILKNDKNLLEKIEKAVWQFSEAFEISLKDLREWAYSQAVLSAWWTFEENGANWKSDLDLAEVWQI